jgi:hypothetical protein
MKKIKKTKIEYNEYDLIKKILFLHENKKLGMIITRVETNQGLIDLFKLKTKTNIRSVTYLILQRLNNEKDMKYLVQKIFFI